jgi:hypothetical protein
MILAMRKHGPRRCCMGLSGVAEKLRFVRRTSMKDTRMQQHRQHRSKSMCMGLGGQTEEVEIVGPRTKNGSSNGNVSKNSPKGLLRHVKARAGFAGQFRSTRRSRLITMVNINVASGGSSGCG